MKVIVCGAGQVGFHIARHLATENNNVTVVDHKPELVRKISDTLDVRGIVGFASHPDVLEQAGANGADMLIAVTHADEVNMVACQVAHSLFDLPTKIARIRSQSYLQPIWADLFRRDHMPIDVIISPEVEVARAIERRLQVPGAFDMIPLADGRVRVLGVRAGEDCPLINTPLRQLTSLFPSLHIMIVGIVRDDKFVVPDPDDQMLAGDQVYFVVDSDHQERAMAAFGFEDAEARRIIIVGGGNIGLFLAQEIEQHHGDVNIKLIELDQARAEFVAQRLNRTIVLNGDAIDPEILEEANVREAETMVTVSDDDEINILAALLAKRSGCKRVVSLINKVSYEPLMTTLGIDVVVSPRSITASKILQHIRHGRIRAVHSLREGFGEVIEAEALETSSLVGTPLRDIKLPNGIIIGALIREDEVIIPRGETIIRTGDDVIVFAASKAVKQVEKMFAVSLEYF